jgi:predicted alpha/beta superfamily hydrolase
VGEPDYSWLKIKHMRKVSLLTLLLIATVLQISNAQGTGNPIVIGTVESMYSNVLKEERKLWMYIPKSNSAQQRYPVLYLLDAESNFNSAAAIIRKMAGRWPDMIIVGIANTERNRDLTPTKVADYRGSGGGESFVRFIKNELIPHIDSLYPTSTYRLLSGHSLGGLTVANVFANHTDLFNAYIIIDPTLTFDDRKLLQQVEKTIAGKKFANQALFLGIANNLPVGMDTLAAQKDTSSNTLFFRSHMRFIQALRPVSGNDLRWRHQFYPEEGHGTVQLVAEYDAFRFIFDYYQFKMSRLMSDPAYDGDSAIIAHFSNISRNLGYTVPPPEGLVNEAGYFYLARKIFDKAYRLFALNISNFPKSANVYDSMGDLHAARDDRGNAIEFYSKALDLKELTKTRKKLESLRMTQP